MQSGFVIKEMILLQNEVVPIKDSVFEMRGGKVKESIANKIRIFSFSRIMMTAT
jgi:hypothetical protein